MHKVEVEWILSLSQHLVKRQYVEPHYDTYKGQVVAYEKTTLYGLVLVEKKPVSYGHIDKDVSRELFIRGALVEGRYGENKRIKNGLKNYTISSHFYCHQVALLTELHDLEAKSRRRDIVVDDEELFQFYDERLPNDIVNLDGFESWRKQVEQKEPRLLFIERGRLMQRSDAHVTAAQFPDSLDFNGVHIPVSYHFDPVHRDDGVTISVPMSGLSLLSPERLEWLVPGLLSEKITAMIKALPKQWRKQFAPVPAVVEKILPNFFNDKKNQAISLSDFLSEQLHRCKGVQVPEKCWQEMTLDNYYLMNIHVVDEKGKVIDQGRDLTVLRERYRTHVQDQLQVSGNDFEQTGLTDWSFGELPCTHILKQGGLSITVYPCLLQVVI